MNTRLRIMARLQSLLVAIAVVLLGFSTKLQAIEVYNTPSDIYWGCDYVMTWEESGGKSFSLSIIKNGDETRPVLTIARKLDDSSPLVHWIPLPEQIPAGDNYQFFTISSSGSKWKSPPARVIPRASPPSGTCVIGRASTTFSVPSSISMPITQTSTSDRTVTTTSTSKVASSSASSSNTISTSSSDFLTSMSNASPTGTGTSDRVSCHEVDPRVPDTWTCRKDQNCVTLEEGSSAICCDTAITDYCQFLAKVDCKPQGQDIFTTSRSERFPTCGDKCCPFGYNCATPPGAGSFCTMMVERSSIGKSPEELANRPSGPASNSSGNAIETISATIPAAGVPTLPSVDGVDSDSPSDNTTNHEKQPISAGAVAGIAVGGFAGLAIAAAVVFVILRRQNKNKDEVGDRDIKPYDYTTNVGSNGAMGPLAREQGVNKEIGQHFEKDGEPIKSPIQSSLYSPSTEKGGQRVQHLPVYEMP